MTRPHTECGAAPIYTVAIPVHNKAPYIARCLASVFAQTEPRFEVIVVDDASTDGSARALAQWQDPRLRLLRRTAPSPGGYAARNLAIAEARAPWIAFLDADDEWLPDHLARIEAMRRTAGADAGCLFAGFDMVLEDGRRVAGPTSRLAAASAPLDLRGFLAAWLAIGDCPAWTSATVVRADILQAVGGFPAGRCVRGGDKDTWLRVLSRSTARYSGQVGAVYRRDAGNRTTRDLPPNRAHCVCDTVDDLLAAGPPADLRRLLQRVANLELLGYAKLISRVRRPSWIMARRFHGLASPAWLLLIVVLCLWPGLRRRPLARRLAALLRTRPAVALPFRPDGRDRHPDRVLPGVPSAYPPASRRPLADHAPYR
jgi:succinoglycan biosynthesis protein ExoO